MGARHASMWDRLTAQVIRDGDCWLWTGSTRRHGGGDRPAVSMRTPASPHPRQFNAARLMCEFFHGPPPTPQHEASHLCETTSSDSWLCIHPWHLMWETKRENIARRNEARGWATANHPDNDPDPLAGEASDPDDIPF